MIEPETSEQLLDRICNGSSVTLNWNLNGWFQQVRDKKGQLIYIKDVSTCRATGNIEVLEEWWEHNDVGQVIYTKDSEGIECWNDYDKEGKCCGYKDNKGKSSGTLAEDKPLTGVNKEEKKAFEQRLGALDESSLDHMSDQMKLIIKVMSAEYTGQEISND